jgi:hypothetical protein
MERMKKVGMDMSRANAALRDIDDQINGDPILRRANEPSARSLLVRVNIAWNEVQPTGTFGAFIGWD